MTFSRHRIPPVCCKQGFLSVKPSIARAQTKALLQRNKGLFAPKRSRRQPKTTMQANAGRHFHAPKASVCRVSAELFQRGNSIAETLKPLTVRNPLHTFHAQLHKASAWHGGPFLIFRLLPPHFNLQQKDFLAHTLHFPTKCLYGKRQMTIFAKNTVVIIIAPRQSFVNHTRYFPYQIVLCAHPTYISFCYGL